MLSPYHVPPPRPPAIIPAHLILTRSSNSAATLSLLQETEAVVEAEAVVCCLVPAHLQGTVQPYCLAERTCKSTTHHRLSVHQLAYQQPSSSNSNINSLRAEHGPQTRL